jgi:hypothetical protein
MKNHKIILSFILFAVTIFSYAQRAVPLSSQFSYMQPPLVLLSKDNSFRTEAEITYEQEVNEEKETNDYEMIEWKSLPTKEKIKRKATDGANVPENAYFPTIYSQERLTSKIAIEGLQTSQESGASLKITLNRPVCVSSVRSEKVTRGETTTKIWKVDVTTTVVVNLTITDDNGNTESKTYTGKAYYTDPTEHPGKLVGKGITQYKQKKSEKMCFKSTEGPALDKALNQINGYLSERYGFIKKKRRAPVYFFKARKFEYDKIAEAAQTLVGGYRLIENSENKEKFESTLLAAINVFETALEEYKPMAKKVRVDDGVASYLYLNIAEAYLWLKDFAKCKEALGQYQSVQSRSKQSFKSKISSDFNTANPVAHFNQLNSLEKSLEERWASVK